MRVVILDIKSEKSEVCLVSSHHLSLLVSHIVWELCGIVDNEVGCQVISNILPTHLPKCGVSDLQGLASDDSLHTE